MTHQQKVFGLIVLTAALIGANFSVLKFTLDHTTPILLASMRTVIGGTFLLSLALLRGERIPTRRDDPLNIFIVSFSITTVSSALLVFGVSRVPAGIASLMASTMPLFTAVLSLAMLRTGTSRSGQLGLLIGFVGTAVLAAPTLSGDTGTLGVVALVASALAWAYGTVHMKWKDFSRVSPGVLVGVQLYMSAAVLVPFALLVEGTADTDWSVGLLVPLLYNAIPANAITFSLMALIVKMATPTQAASTAYLIPLFGVFFGWLFRDEALGPVEAVGAVLVLTGVYLVVNASARRTAAAT